MSNGTYFIFIGVIVTVLAMTICIILVALRGKYAKLVKGHILVQYIPVAGEDWTVLEKIDDGLFTVTRKGEKGGKTWRITDLSTRPSKYPVGWPGWIAAACSKVIVREDSLEPVSDFTESGKEFTPAHLYNIVFQKFGALIAETDKIISDLENKVRSARSNMMLLYFLVFIAIVAAGVAAYFGYTNHADILLLKKGLGITVAK